MFKQIKKNLMTMESMISLIGFVNTSFGILGNLDISLIIRAILLLTGLISIVYIIYSSSQSQKVSNFITNNEVNYKKQIRTSFIDFEDKKRWMFYALSDKFPSLSCGKLKKLINKHYEFIRDK